jgi:hypothetical protein
MDGRTDGWMDGRTDGWMDEGASEVRYSGSLVLGSERSVSLLPNHMR